MDILQRYRKYLIIIYPVIFLLAAKVGASPSVGLSLILFPIVLSVIGLSLLSPPIAGALVFLSHNLIGQISMSHPGVLVQVVPAVFLILTLFYVRRNEFNKNHFYSVFYKKETWCLLFILLVFAMGFIKGVIALGDGTLGSKFLNLFKASHGGSYEYYPYVFMSRWLVFILIGSLCCRGSNELKIFLLAFAVFVTTQLIAIPWDMYHWVLTDLCSNISNYTGLQALNVNRAYLGYLLATSSIIFLTLGTLNLNKNKTVLYYVLAGLMLFFCIIAGSKGPVAALGAAMAYLFIRSNKYEMGKLVLYGISFLVIAFITPKIFSCSGGLQSIFKASVTTTQSSISVRQDLAKAEFKRTEHSLNLFGKGFGNSLGLTESTFLDPITNKPRIIVSSSGSHNLFIDLYVDLGIIGVVIFTLSLIGLITIFYLNNNGSENRLLSRMLGGALVVIFIYSVLATAPSMATFQALFVGVLFGVNLNTPLSEKQLI